MDKKDEIILQQLDVIRSMTERNLRSMNADFWGTPLSPADKTPEKAPDKTPEKAPDKEVRRPGAADGGPGAAAQGGHEGPAGGAGQLHRSANRQGGGP